MSNAQEFYNEVWPHDHFCCAPPKAKARELAELVAKRTNGIDMLKLPSKLGFRLRHTTWAGGIQALLVGLNGGGFAITVNTNVTPRILASLGQHDLADEQVWEMVHRFTIGHELGHTFFFRWGPKLESKKIRYNSGCHDEHYVAEEQWCDWFSMYYMLRTTDFQPKLIRRLAEPNKQSRLR
ncbi:MAG TPA: hypothetical protein VLE72_03405 [Candidatus Saccharimonadales bacterium]|nr:hypothetical protein [Candidatus Saccharimonadales bacterium]